MKSARALVLALCVAWSAPALALTGSRTGGSSLGKSPSSHPKVPAHSEPTEAADAPELLAPEATATVLGPNPSYVGQMVQIEVELLRDNRDPDQQAPFFPEMDVSGAIAILSTNAPPPEIREKDGVQRLAQKRRYLVFPQMDGELKIPPLTISIPLAQGEIATAKTKALSIQANIPRGVVKNLPLVAREVQVKRTVDGNLDALRVGDAFTVSVQLTAYDTDPVMLPELSPPEVPGLSRYPGESSTSAQAERGNYRATRTDKATYVANDWGIYELPEVSVFWLDARTGEYGQATAEAVSFRARVNPSLGAGCVGGPQEASRIGGAIGFLILLAWLGLRTFRKLSAERLRRARVQRSVEEKQAFATLRHVAATGDDAGTLSALYRWLDLALHGTTTLEELRAAADNEAITTATRALEERVSHQSSVGKAVDLIAPLATFRNSSRERSAQSRLPGLNE